MSKTITRRDILKFTGGGILGIMLSPIPWKLLDDSAIWTQNWSLTPKLSHGPITAAFSHCTLCNGGCAIKAQSVSGMPYYLSGVQNHPEGHGILCTCGLAGHHMAHHPLRIVHPHKFVGKSDNSTITATTLQESLDAIVKQIKDSKGTIAILDKQPNRAISGIYRDFLTQIPNGLYLNSPSQEDSTISVLKEMLNQQTETLGFDFENTKLILSFNAPLLDSWGNPGRMTTIRNSKKTKFIQIDSRYSRTAMQSDKWIALNPGTEKVLALSIAHVLMFNNLIPSNIQRSVNDLTKFKESIKNFNPEETFHTTGVPATDVNAIAHELATAESAIVLSSADAGGGPLDYETEKAIASLNVLINNVGKTGGIITRKEIPGYKNNYKQTQWMDIPDNSISVLIVDGADSGYALPWSLIEKKLLKNDNLVVSFSPVLNEISAHSDYLIPSPAHLETLSDVPTTVGNRVSTFALSTPLIQKQEYTTEPIDVIKEIASKLSFTLQIPSNEGVLKQKVESIHSAKRGSIYIYSTQNSVMVNELSSPDDLWSKLTEGAIWIDEEEKQKHSNKFSLKLFPSLPITSNEKGIPLIAYGWRGATTTSQISPILSKVFQETELRNVNGIVSVNPSTALQLGVKTGETVSLSTNNGSMNVRVKIAATVRPGIIEASIAPLPNGIETPSNPSGNNILNLCEVTNNGTWRITNATLLKV
jgi:anaerobic selenocysteine-containing dehydrogenase